MKHFVIGLTVLLITVACSKDEMDIPNNDLPNSSMYFPPINSDSWSDISIQELEWNSNGLDPLLNFVEENDTKAFIILKDGKIAVEWYGNEFTKNELWYWASAGKVLTATTVGIAEQEELLSIGDKTSAYLGEGWTSLTLEKEDKITILNQLTMTTGLNTLAFDCTDSECLLFVANASERWAYHNAPYTLLQSVVESASNTNFETYFNDKLRNKIGMNGSWYSTNGFNNVFFSTARSMARFGLMILNKGVWDEDVIINENYVNNMTNASQNINKSYGYLWWLNGKSSYMIPQKQKVFEGFLIPNAPADMFSGLGKNDQKIYVVPSQNLVIVRMGEIADEDSLVPISFDNELWEKINGLIK